jgi:hypothetical protein
VSTHELQRCTEMAEVSVSFLMRIIVIDQYNGAQESGIQETIGAVVVQFANNN